MVLGRGHRRRQIRGYPMLCQEGFESREAFSAGLHHIVPQSAVDVDVQISGGQHSAGKIEAAAAVGKLPSCPGSNLHNLSFVQQQHWFLDALPRREQDGSSEGNHVLSRIVTEGISNQESRISLSAGGGAGFWAKLARMAESQSLKPPNSRPCFLMRRYRRAFMFWLAHQQDQGGDHQKQNSQEEKCGVEGNHGRLARDHAEYGGIGLVGGGGKIHSPRHETGARSINHLSRGQVEGGHVRDQVVDVGLCVARHNGGGSGDAYTASEIPHDIEDAGGIAHLLFGNGVMRGGGQGNENKAQRKPLDELRPGYIPVSGVQVEMGEGIHAESGAQQSSGQQLAGFKLRQQGADDGHGDERSQSARQHGHARVQGGIAQQSLQQDGNQHHAAIQAKAQRGHQEDTCGIGAHAEYSQVDHGMPVQQFVNHEQRQSDSGHDGQNQDEMRAEPVVLLALIEHDLQRADSDGQKTDAPVVHAAGLALDIGGIEDEQFGHDQAGDAYRQVDVEDPAPAVTVGNPAAHHRAEHGRNHDSQAPESHGLAPLLGRERLQHNGLGKGLQAAAAGALQHTKNDQEGQIGSHAAQDRSEGEPGNRSHQ